MLKGLPTIPADDMHVARRRKRQRPSIYGGQPRSHFEMLAIPHHFRKPAQVRWNGVFDMGRHGGMDGAVYDRGVTMRPYVESPFS